MNSRTLIDKLAPLGLGLLGAIAGLLICLTMLGAAFAGPLIQTIVVGIAMVAGGLLAARIARWRAWGLTDPTTGLYNRRYLFTRLERELKQLRKQAAPLGLIVLDIDDMKRCNDAYGHLIGDALLASVARTLQVGVRRSDAVVRWGGEEFAVILPHTTVSEALTMAERMRARVAALTIDAGEGRQARTTISVGVALSVAPSNPVDLVARADSAMYAAKRQKNQVILAT
jgi:diguanylate cyclase (GGDEF)-like protein